MIRTSVLFKSTITAAMVNLLQLLVLITLLNEDFVSLTLMFKGRLTFVYVRFPVFVM